LNGVKILELEFGISFAGSLGKLPALASLRTAIEREDRDGIPSAAGSGFLRG